MTTHDKAEEFRRQMVRDTIHALSGMDPKIRSIEPTVVAKENKKSERQVRYILTSFDGVRTWKINPFCTPYHYQYFLDLKINMLALKRWVDETVRDFKNNEATFAEECNALTIRENLKNAALAKKSKKEGAPDRQNTIGGYRIDLAKAIKKLDESGKKMSAAIIDDRPIDAVIEWMIEELTDKEGKYYEHIIVRNAYIIHGSHDRDISLMLYTDDGLTSVGDFVRNVLPMTGLADTITSSEVGWNRGYRAVGSQLKAPSGSKPADKERASPKKKKRRSSRI